MIGVLNGILISKQAPIVIIDCGGVGYEVATPMSTFLDLPDIGEKVLLLTHLQVRENAHEIYGFGTKEEKSLFRSLLSVSGVGAKMALGILSGISVSNFHHCIHSEDVDLLVKIPGIGKKTAERLLVEMRDKIADLSESDVSSLSNAKLINPKNEAIDALVSLGYKSSEIRGLVSKLDTDNKSSEEIIRLALRQAVK